MSETQLSPKERKVLALLSEAWNEFLDINYGGFVDHKDRFLNAIHEAQSVIAVRVARRVDPEFWK